MARELDTAEETLTVTGNPRRAYRVGKDIYELPEEEIESFLSIYPNARPATGDELSRSRPARPARPATPAVASPGVTSDKKWYLAGRDVYAFPVEEEELFLSTFPDARPLSPERGEALASRVASPTPGEFKKIAREHGKQSRAAGKEATLYNGFLPPFIEEFTRGGDVEEAAMATSYGIPGATRPRDVYPKRERERDARDYLANTAEGQEMARQYNQVLAGIGDKIGSAGKEVEGVFGELRKRIEAKGGGRQFDKESLALRDEWGKAEIARQYVKKSRELWDAVQERGSASALRQFGNEAGRSLPGVIRDLATFGVSEISDANATNAAIKPLVDKYNENERRKENMEEEIPYTPAEQALMNAIATSQFAMDELAGKLSVAQNVARGAMESIPFMASFGVAGGLTKGLSRAGTRLITRQVKERIGNKVLRGIANAAAQGAKGAVRAPLMNLVDPRAYAEAMNDTRGTATYDVAGGKVVYTGQEGVKTFGEAFADMMVSRSVENLSEMSGGIFSRMIPKNAGKLFRLPANKAWGRALKETALAAGWNGTPEEFLEEQVSTILHSMLDDGQARWEDLVDPRQQLITALTVLSIGSVPGSISAVGNSVQAGMQRRDLNRAAREIEKIAGEDAAEILEVLGEGDTGSREEALALLLSTDAPDALKAAATRYYAGKLRRDVRDGMNDGEVEEAVERARAAVDAAINPSTGRVTIVTARGEKEAYRLARGKIITREDGSIDAGASDKTVYVENADGKIIPVDVGDIDKIEEDREGEEVAREIGEKIAREGIREQQDAEAIPLEIGQVVTAIDSNVVSRGEITRVNPDGTFLLLDEATGIEVLFRPGDVIDEDNMEGVENGARVIYRDSSGKIASGVMQDAYTRRNQQQVVVDGRVIPTGNVIGLEPGENPGDAGSTPPAGDDVPPGGTTAGAGSVSTGDVPTGAPATPGVQAAPAGETTPVEQVEQAPGEQAPAVPPDAVPPARKVNASKMSEDEALLYMEGQLGREATVDVARGLLEKARKELARLTVKIGEAGTAARAAAALQEITKVARRVARYEAYIGQENATATPDAVEDSLPVETDGNGILFVRSSDGTTVFGEIDEEQARSIGTGVAAPIKLTEGNKDHGRVHIAARESQLKQNGYNSVEEFVEDVSRNHDEIRTGNLYIDSEGNEKETFLLVKKGKLGRVLYVELSPNGDFYNVNSGGVFKNSYVDKRGVLWSASTEHSAPPVTAPGFPATQLNTGSDAVSALPQSRPLPGNKVMEETPGNQDAGNNLDVLQTSEAVTPDGKQAAPPPPASENPPAASQGVALSREQADALIALMEENAEEAPGLELTPENWESEFGENGEVETPLGNVKMGENQYRKIIKRGRQKEFGMIKPTLTNPDVIVEVPSEAREGQETDRGSSFLFVKSFVRGGKKIRHFEVVTVSKDNLEVAISNHIIKPTQLMDRLSEGRLLWNRYELSGSEASGEPRGLDERAGQDPIDIVHGSNPQSNSASPSLVDGSPEGGSTISPAGAPAGAVSRFPALNDGEEALPSNGSDLHLAENQNDPPDLLPTREGNDSTGKDSASHSNEQETSENEKKPDLDEQELLERLEETKRQLLKIRAGYLKDARGVDAIREANERLEADPVYRRLSEELPGIEEKLLQLEAGRDRAFIEGELPARLPRRGEERLVPVESPIFTGGGGIVNVRPVRQKARTADTRTALFSVAREEKSDGAEDLKGILHDAGNGADVATDGKVMLVIPARNEKTWVEGRDGKEMDVTYPDWKSVVPGDHRAKVTVKEIQPVIDKLAGVSRASRFVINRMLVKIEASGTPYFFNASSLLKAVNAMHATGSDSLVFEFGDKQTRAIVIRDGKNPNKLALVMPLLPVTVNREGILIVPLTPVIDNKQPGTKRNETRNGTGHGTRTRRDDQGGSAGNPRPGGNAGTGTGSDGRAAGATGSAGENTPGDRGVLPAGGGGNAPGGGTGGGIDVGGGAGKAGEAVGSDEASPVAPVELPRPGSKTRLQAVPGGKFDFDASGIAPEVAREMQAIKNTAVANGTFMKAPNGKPTKLNERQWLLVRTPGFKKWFGDWEAAALVNLAENVWNGSNESARFDFIASGKLKQKLSEIFGKDVKTLFITDSDIRHAKNEHGSNEDKRGQIDLTPEDFALIPFVMNDHDSAREVRQDNKGNKRVEFSKKVNGTLYVVSVERGKDKGQVITMWKKPSRMFNADALNRTSETTPIGTTKIQQTAQALRDSAKNSSKVVDENGEPRVVYHGSPAKWNVFDFGQARPNADIPAAFFTTDREEAAGFGDTREFFLNTRNPVDKPDSDMRGSEVLQGLKEQGVDGTVVDDSHDGHVSIEYAVFSPGQVKSATGNNGRFDGESDDIRYQEENTGRFRPTGKKKLGRLIALLEKSGLARRVIIDEGKMRARLEEILGKDKAARFMAAWNGSVRNKNRKALRVDENGRNIVWENQDYFISFSHGDRSSYHVALWEKETGSKVGELHARLDGKDVPRDFISVNNVKIDKKHRGKGLSVEMYRALVDFSEDSVKGLSSYLPDRINKKQVPRVWKKFGGVIEGDYENIRFMSAPSGEVYGFVTGEGDVYLDPARMNANTPVHEFGHLWNSFIKEHDPALWKRGVELVRDSSYWEQVNSNPAYAHLSDEEKEDEALAMAIGDRGEAWARYNLTAFARFRGWMHDLWESVKELFGVPSRVNVEELTLEGFTELAVSDLTSGKRLESLPRGDGSRYQVVPDGNTPSASGGIEEARRIARAAIMPREARSVSEAQELIRPLVGKPIANERLGITATISGKNISKLGSQNATEKSISPALHAKAVANIDVLFENALFDVTHPDTKGRPEIERTHRLGSLMFDEETGVHVPVMLTMLEYNDKHGNKIYTVEAVRIEAKEKPAGLMTDGNESPRVPIAGLTNLDSAEDATRDFTAKMQQLIETANSARDNSSEESPGNTRDARFQVVPGDNRSADRGRARAELEAKLSGRVWLGWQKGRWREAYQDNMIAVKRFLEVLRKHGVEIPDSDDFYMQVTALQGKIEASTDVYKKRFQEPLTAATRAIRKAGFSHRAIENYVMLKHSIERDAFMASLDIAAGRKPRKDYSGASAIEEEVGMTAAGYTSDFEERAGKELVDELWKRINAATRHALDVYYRSGKMSREQYNALVNRYKYFVPLRGHDAKTAGDIYNYGEDSMEWFVNPLQAAGGRSSRAAFPFAYIASMNASAISAGLSNALRQTMLRVALRDTTGLSTVSRQWYVKTFDSNGNEAWEARWPEYSEDMEKYASNIAAFEENMKEMEARGDARERNGKLDVGGLFIKKKEAKHHAIPVMVNGEERVIYINGNPRVAEAVTGSNMPDPSRAVNLIKKGSRFMAANFTSRNPRFVVSNMCRDTMMAYTMAFIKEGAAYTGKLGENWPRAANELRKYIAGGRSAIAAEFILNGGKTGYSRLMEMRDVARRLEKQAATGRDTPVSILLDYLQAANDFAENINRLAVYMTSRQVGRSIERSISDAREITVNFGRHGTGRKGARWINSAWLFSNVAFQVLDNVSGAAMKHPGRALVALTAYAALGALIPAVVWLTGGDDDLEEYLGLPGWDLKNNICIPLGGGVLKIPLPQDLRAFYGLGVGAFNCFAGNGDWEKELLTAASSLLDLAPYNLSNAAHSSWAELVPDIGRPVAQLWANRTFSGRKIYNEYANKNDPGWKQARVNRCGERYTEDWMVGFVEMLDRVTGGDGVKRGAISLNPDKVNHLDRGYLGGVYNMASQAFELMYKLHGLVTEGNFSLKARETPLRAFYSSYDDNPAGGSRLDGRFHDLLDKVEKADRHLKGYLAERQAGTISLEQYTRSREKLKPLADLARETRGIQRDQAGIKKLPGDRQREKEEKVARRKKEVLEKYEKYEKERKNKKRASAP